MSNQSGKTPPQAPKKPAPKKVPAASTQKQPPVKKPVNNKPPAAQKPTANRPGQQRPAGAANKTKGLVRPVPKAKVRRARLLIGKVDPWSVFKISFLLSVALGIVTVVGGVAVWTIMDLTGIFDEVNALMAMVLGTEGGGQSIQDLVSLGQVASMSTIIAVINVVIITLLSMLASVLYNISASLVGGVGVTLTDD